MKKIKIKLDVEREANLSSVAVEKIEDRYDKPLQEIVNGNLRASLVNYIIFASLIDCELSEADVKKYLHQNYSYTETIQIWHSLIGDDPNEKPADDTEATLSNLPAALG